MADLGKIAGKAVEDLRAQWEPVLVAEAQRVAAQQINGLVEGLRRGQTLPDLIPTAPAPVDVKADARNRAQRTFLQNLLIDLVTAVLAALAVGLADLDITSQEAWLALGALLLKTAASAPISYVMRVKFGVKDTTLPTPPAVPIPVLVAGETTEAPRTVMVSTPPPAEARVADPADVNLRGE